MSSCAVGPGTGVVRTRLTTVDGRPFELHTVGSGPGVVLVHGSAVSAKDYRRPAAALAGRHTVHLYDRRGRGQRGPVDDSHGVASDVDDLAVVLGHTGARDVLAHSYGGLVALQGAPRLPIDRLAVFDGAVPIDGAFPSDFVEPFARAAAAGDFALAMAVLSKGLGTAGPVSLLPVAVQRLLAHAFAVTPMGREWRSMLAGAVAEAREVQEYDRPAATYSAVDSEVLLVTGARSPGYFARAAEQLAEVLPHARHVVVAGAGHNAINIAMPPLMQQIEQFLR